MGSLFGMSHGLSTSLLTQLLLALGKLEVASALEWRRSVAANTVSASVSNH